MTITSSENIFASAVILTEYKDLLSTKDLATIFGITKQTVYREMKQGKFGTPIQIGRAYKVPKIYILNRYFKTH